MNVWLHRFHDYGHLRGDAADLPAPEPAEPPRFMEPIEIDCYSHLVVSNRREFYDRVLKLMDQGVRSFVVNCRHTDDIDPASWGMLRKLTRHVESHGGSLRLKHLSPALRTNLVVVRGDGLVDVLPPEVEA